MYMLPYGTWLQTTCTPMASCHQASPHPAHCSPSSGAHIRQCLLKYRYVISPPTLSNSPQRIPDTLLLCRLLLSAAPWTTSIYESNTLITH